MIFWLTTIATIFANIFITKEIAFNEYKTKHLREKMQTLAPQAVARYEEQGRAELRAWYKTLAREEGIRVVLLNQDEKPVIKLPKAVKYYRHPAYHDNEEKYEEAASFGRARIENHLLKLSDQHVISAKGNAYILRILPSPYLKSRFNPEALHAYRLSATFIIIAIGSILIARSIARPIRLLREASREVSKGNLDFRVSPLIGKRKDEIGQLATTFDAMTGKICHLMEEQKRLFADISHEIRTPLTRQQLAIELLRSQPNNAMLLDKVASQNSEIEHLISQILNLLNTELNLTPNKERISIKALIEACCDQAKLQLDSKSQVFELTLEKSGQIDADPNLLARAIDNILINAHKYSPHGSCIQVTSYRTETHYLIEISDEGPGIPDTDITHIVAPFYRTDKSRHTETGGFGLGLAIASNIIEQHEGELSFENIQPHGLKVTIALKAS